MCFARSAALLLRYHAAMLARCCCAATSLRCYALLFVATLLRAPAALLRLSVFIEE